MTDVEEHGGGERDDDVVAAEYVLGVLPDAEREEAARRVGTERGFAMLVAAWEERLSPMNEEFGTAEPPARVWREVEDRLLTEPRSASRAGVGFWQSLAVWRVVSLSALAAAAILGAVLLTGLPQPVPGPQEIASLSADGSDSSFLALREPDGTLRITRTGVEAPIGQVYELWAIAGNDAPVSLGLLASGEVTRTALPDTLASLSDGAVTLAVTVEPPGGAPGGVATGPVVALGQLKKI